MILLVAVRGLEVHARTQTKRVRVQHRFEVAEERVCPSVDSVVYIAGVRRIEGVLAVESHALRAGRHGRLTEVGYVGAGVHRIVVFGFVEHVRLRIVFLLCTK